MNLSRRKFARVCALTATGRALAGALPSLAQVQGEHINTTTVHPVPAIQDTETPEQKSDRMQWFREARFGMFIHWGLYSILAGRRDGKEVPGIGEWIMNRASIPVAQYQALAARFNPTQFSAAGIVGLAKSAGMKYIVITSKHHDGFAMFDSKANPFNIVQATPFKRDPLRELAAECRKQGLKLGFYYSQDQDWTAPGGAAYKTGDHQPPTFHWDPAQNGSFATYLETKAIPQIRELLENYDEFPAIVWFHKRHDSGTGRQDRDRPQSASKADLEQSAGGWLQRRHGDP
jgi:alpha-L-fucosidase